MHKDLVFLFEPEKQAQAEEPGHVDNRLNEWTNAYTKAEELQIHSKTIRTICVRAGDIHVNGLESLLIVKCYLKITGKPRQHEQIIIQWSGAYANWQRRVARGIREAEQTGYLKRIGKSLEITEKAQRLIEDYNRTFEASIDHYQRGAAQALEKSKANRKKRTERETRQRRELKFRANG